MRAVPGGQRAGNLRMSLRTHAVVVIASTLAIAACRIGETQYDTITNPVITASAIKTCTGGFANPDLSTLTTCGDGQGHCYEGDKTALVGLPSCPAGGSGDTCVPDKVLTANGGMLKSCTFFIGNAPGACVSMLVDDIAQHKDSLKQDVCDENERCSPCTDPRDGSNTHLCEPYGVYQDACKGGTGAAPEACCHRQGVCLEPSAIPDDVRDHVESETCSSGKLCAPAALVNGQPQTCHALGASGVCIDLCFAAMLGPAAPVLRSGCNAASVCLPCAIGKSYGMPGCD